VKGRHIVVEEGFDYGIPDTYFPHYRTKYLFIIANYEIIEINTFFESLSKNEFLALDPENRVEYLFKLCISNWRDRDYRIMGDAKINQYKNMLTLINYAVYLVEKYDFQNFSLPVKKTQIWLEKLVKEFISGYEKTAERLRNRRKI
jgi:hypothetical protein